MAKNGYVLNCKTATAHNIIHIPNINKSRPNIVNFIPLKVVWVIGVEPTTSF